MRSTTILICGPTGVGKSTLIKVLLETLPSLRYVRPHMTRELRPGEVDKIPVDEDTFNRMVATGDFVIVNALYGSRYGTSKSEIASIIGRGCTPIVDWPVDRIAAFGEATGLPTFAVYLAPGSWEGLIERGGSRLTPERLQTAREEWERYRSGWVQRETNGIIVATSSPQALARDVLKMLPEGIVI